MGFQRPVHLRAEEKLKELVALLKPLYPSFHTAPDCRVPPNLPSHQSSESTHKSDQDGWLRYLGWEKENPLDFDLQTREGQRRYYARLNAAFKKAVLPMRFHPEIWYCTSPLVNVLG